jgi:hypothetical protein
MSNQNLKDGDTVVVAAANPKTRINGKILRECAIHDGPGFLIEWADGTTSGWRTDRLQKVKASPEK